jgi:transmembrane sensor
MIKSPVTDELADRAIEWFVRLRAEDITEAERGTFFEWLREARVHQQAFVEILRLWEDLSVVRQMDFEELRPFPQIWELKRKVEAAAAS